MSDTKEKSDKSSLTKTVVLFIVIAIFLRASVVEAYKIPSGSMLPTLQIGDHILVTKFNYGIRIPFFKKSAVVFNKPKRGEIVVFTRVDDPNTHVNNSPFTKLKKMTGLFPIRNDESSINIIKRVVGLPGDKIEVKEGQVFVNDNLLIEPYAVWIEGGNGKFGPYYVPEDKVLMLGDNRDQSKDSRFWHDPFLPINLIKGKALIIYFNMNSLSRIGKLIN